MKSLFLDATVPLHAAGGDSPWRESSRAIIAAASVGHARLHLSVEAGEEFLFHRTRRVGPVRARRDFDALHRLVLWHAFDEGVLTASAELVSRGVVRGRDAVHAATALGAGFDQIVSADTDFDDIPGLTRVDPREWPDGGANPSGQPGDQ